MHTSERNLSTATLIGRLSNDSCLVCLDKGKVIVVCVCSLQNLKFDHFTEFVVLQGTAKKCTNN